MDDQLTTLEHHVAEAAQAWLDDPQDAAVYARLLLAVQTRRLHLRERALAELVDDELVTGSDGESPAAPAVPVDPERLVVKAVGDELAGDPQAVLRRLRGLG